MTKYFRNAFASGGDRDPVPDLAAGTLVNYEKGYTPEYELDPDVDPSGHYVGRRRMNQIFNDITSNLKFWQENGVPAIVENDGTGSPLSYKKGFVGSYLGTVYRALVDDTTTLPPSAEWVKYDLQGELNTKVGLTGDQTIAGVKTFSSFPVTPSAAPTEEYQAANKKYVDDGFYLQPSMTGSITLNGTTNNTVVMTDIVTKLELEIGDVIRIDTGTYNKLHTVESITNNSSIIVNYEHAGNRANGSLKLHDFTGQATVTRIAKWFNAPIGLGQAWVDVKASRLANTDYANSTGRTISVFARLGQAAVQDTRIIVNGVVAGIWIAVGNNTSQGASAVVQRDAVYRVVVTGGSNVINWSELR